MIEIVFPPAASPTCVPLGVSFLKAYIDSNLGADKIKISDLNIFYWNHIGSRKDNLEGYISFTKGKSGLFSRDFYEPFLSIQQELKFESDIYLEMVKKWLDKDILSDELSELFTLLTNEITEDIDPLMFSCLFPDQLLFALGFTKWLSGRVDRKLYLGGASVLILNSQELLENALWIQGVFTGEGEISLETFIRDGESSSVPGLHLRGSDPVINVERVVLPPMDRIPIPDFTWADISLYFNPEPVLPVQFSRSCKWRRCRFCAHNFSFGKYRCMTAKNAVDMLEHYLTTLNARHFYITDQYLDATFLEPFAKELIKRNLYIRYTFMGRPAEDMTEELLEQLAESGCRWISWGVESGNKRLLDTAGKGTDPDEVSRVLKDSSSSGIKNQALMIFGLPGSNDLAAEDTYTFLQENRPWIHSHTASEFQLYKGTPFGNNPEKYGLRVTGKVVFCNIQGKPLYSVKREYTNASTEDDPEMLRGPLEAKKWRRRGVWVYPDTFWNSLPSEHYLLLSSREWDMNHPENPMPENRVS